MLKQKRNHLFASPSLMLAIILMVGCSTTTKRMPLPTVQASHPPVVNYALSLQGAPYSPGKASPQEGFDCSGFIQHVYERHGVYLPRTTVELSQSLPPIDVRNLLPGDLVFFNTSGLSYSHVGLFVKNDAFIHAPSSRSGKVMVSSLKNPYWRSHYTGARRPPSPWLSKALN